MIIRQRAIQVEDKQERYNAILRAAEQVMLHSPDQSANVAEVAEVAGLAKGTVYLYFPSKEELLLALHERNVEAFFSALIARLDQPQPIGIDDMLALTREHMFDRPLFLPLAAQCLASMGQVVSADWEMAFKQRLAGRLARAGEGIERHFPQLPPGGGILLLHVSYALILGLWQLSPERCPAPAMHQHLAGAAWNYADSVSAALRALWQGTLGADTSNTSLCSSNHTAPRSQS